MIKYYLHTLICLSFLMMVMGCHKENYEDESLQIENSLDLNLKYSHISYNKVSKKHHNLLRTVMNNSTGFSYERNEGDPSTFLIDTTDVVRFETENNYMSHTFRVINDESSNVLQNIVISEHENDSTSIHLAEYTLDITIGELAHRNPESHILDSQFYSLDDPTLNYQNRIDVGGNGADCIDINTYTELFCRDSDGNWQVDTGVVGNGCVGVSKAVEITVVTLDAGCVSGGGGSGSTSGTGSGNSGGGDPGGGTPGGGTSGGNDTTQDQDCFTFDAQGNCITVITKPISNLKYHRSNLKKQSDNVKIKNKIDELMADVPVLLKEDGAQFDLLPGEPVDYTIVNPVETGTQFTNFPDIRPNTEVNMHMHPRFGIITDDNNNIIGTEELLTIPSHKDVLYVFDLFEETSSNENISSILVSDEGVFALRVTNPARVTFLENKFDSRRRERKFIEHFFEQVEYVEGENTFVSDLEFLARFINFINSYKINYDDDNEEEGLGLTLFQAEFDENGNITGWTQKS